MAASCKKFKTVSDAFVTPVFIRKFFNYLNRILLYSASQPFLEKQMKTWQFRLLKDKELNEVPPSAGMQLED